MRPDFSTKFLPLRLLTFPFTPRSIVLHNPVFRVHRCICLLSIFSQTYSKICLCLLVFSPILINLHLLTRSEAAFRPFVAFQSVLRHSLQILHHQVLLSALVQDFSRPHHIVVGVFQYCFKFLLVLFVCEIRVLQYRRLPNRSSITIGSFK